MLARSLPVVSHALTLVLIGITMLVAEVAPATVAPSPLQIQTEQAQPDRS